MAEIKSVANSLSDETVREKTGKSVQEWFAVLDRFGVAEKGHTATANYLSEKHGVSAWWSQQITINYEQERGLRKPGQRSSGKFAVNISRTISASLDEVWALLSTPKGWDRWLSSKTNFKLAVGQKYTNADGDEGEFTRIEPPHPPNSSGEVARIDMTWDHPQHCPGSRVAIQLIQTASGKIQVAVTHDKLESQAHAEEMKKGWTEVMDCLKSALGS